MRRRDVMSNQECCAALQEMLAAGEKDMGTVCEELIDVCLEKGSKDNMSAIVVAMGGAHFGAGEGLEPRRRCEILSPCDLIVPI